MYFGQLFNWNLFPKLNKVRFIENMTNFIGYPHKNVKSIHFYCSHHPIYIPETIEEIILNNTNGSVIRFEDPSKTKIYSNTYVYGRIVNAIPYIENVIEEKYGVTHVIINNSTTQTYNADKLHLTFNANAHITTNCQNIDVTLNCQNINVMSNCSIRISCCCNINMQKFNGKIKINGSCMDIHMKSGRIHVFSGNRNINTINLIYEGKKTSYSTNFAQFEEGKCIEYYAYIGDIMMCISSNKYKYISSASNGDLSNFKFDEDIEIIDIPFAIGLPDPSIYPEHYHNSVKLIKINSGKYVRLFNGDKKFYKRI